MANEEIGKEVPGVGDPTMKNEVETTPKKMRQVIIETDGDIIKLEKAEVSGKIELIAVLQSVIGFINNQK